MKRTGLTIGVSAALFLGAMVISISGREPQTNSGLPKDGQHLFEQETFGGNGRTCLTCHSRETGTVSPEEARQRFLQNPHDPLFLHDGSDDGQGTGATRMQADATVLVEIPLPPNVRLADDPSARSVVVRRGVPSTLNTPGLDPVLMLDGRQPTLEAQALGAIGDHAQGTIQPDDADLAAIKSFQLTDAFFSSPVLRDFARGGAAPTLPVGVTESERRGRRFFEDLPPDPATFKDGLCSACHSGPMLNATNQFLPIPGVTPGSRFASIGVSEINAAGNPLREFIFINPDGTESRVNSPDPGRALITGVGVDPSAEHVNAFKISSLWNVARTAPYFHDNSAKTLEAVAAHYALFFSLITDPDGPGPAAPLVVLTPQDQADMVAYMKLLR